jgi:hypothetical protein
MPTTAITKQTAPGQYPTAWGDLTFAAMDQANGNHFVSTGKELIIVRNDDAAAQTVTVTGSADPFGRTASIQKSINAAGLAIFGPLPSSYWANNSGQIVLTPSSNNLKVAIVTLP